MRNKMKSRIVALLCVLTICLSLLEPIQVNAVTSSTDVSGVALLKEQITVRMTEVDSYFNEGNTGEYGLLYQLRLITEYEMYTMYLTQYGDKYGFTASDISFYQNKVIQRITTFNDMFSTASADTYTALSLTNNEKKIPSTMKANVTNEIPSYLRSILATLNTEYKTKNDESSKTAWLKEHATLLANIYKNLAIFQDVPNTINNLALKDGNTTTRFSSDYTNSNSSLNNTISKIAEDYSEILSYGKQIATATINADSLEVDTEKELAEIFTNGTLNDEKDLDFEDTPRLSQSYLAILSCSAVYTPFSSYVGDPAFTTALKTIAETESGDVSDALLQTYNKAKDIRKPLYVRDIDDNGNPAGTAEILTIERFIDDIQAGNIGALVVAKGDFHYNSEAASWIYSQFSYSADSTDTSILSNETVEETSEEESINNTVNNAISNVNNAIDDATDTVTSTLDVANLNTSLKIAGLNNTIAITNSMYDNYNKANGAAGTVTLINTNNLSGYKDNTVNVIKAVNCYLVNWQKEKQSLLKQINNESNKYYKKLNSAYGSYKNNKGLLGKYSDIESAIVKHKSDSDLLKVCQKFINYGTTGSYKKAYDKAKEFVATLSDSSLRYNPFTKKTALATSATEEDATTTEEVSVENTGVDITSASSIANTLKNTIILGDDNVKAFKNALKSAGATDTTLKSNKVYFYTESNFSADSLKSNADKIKKITKILDANADEKFQVIIMAGHDLIIDKNKSDKDKLDSEMTKYAENINALVSTLGTKGNYSIAVSPVLPVSEPDLDKKYKDSSDNLYITNTDIESFNSKLDSTLDKTGLDYIASLATSLKNSSDSTKLSDGYNTTDGRIYDPDSIVKVFQIILENVISSSMSEDTYSEVNSILDDTTDAAESAVSEIIDDLSKALYANKTISDETKLSAPVLIYGTKFSRPVDNMTTAILKNIINECVTLENIDNKNTRYLYMDCFGDIVTDDGLIIMPGICNPLLFDANVTAYNPYTVAFMNSYPSVLSRSYYFQVTNSNDVGKYVMFSDANTESASNSAIRMYQISDNNNVKQANYKNVLNIDPKFYANTTDQFEIITPQRFVFGTYEKWANSIDETSMDFYSQSPVVQALCATIDGKVIFPYIQKDDTEYKVATTIAQNSYQHIAYDDETSTYTNKGSLYDAYIIQNYILTCAFGTNNSVGYAKDGLLEYDNYVGNSNSRMATQIIQYSKDLLEKTSSIDGVIGLKSSYEDTILGNVTRTLQENWWLFIVVVIIILLVAFMKMHRDLIEIIILLVASVGVAYAAVFIVPVYLSMFYNVAINNICENLSYEIVGVKTENEDANLENNLLVDDDGNLMLNTTSITLYKVAAKDLGYFYNSVNVAAADVIGGKTEVINQNAGLFVEGDSLKINLDLLFDTLEISGESVGLDGDYLYQIEASKIVSNNVDYYIPYYQFVDGMINKLNTLTQVYGIPRSTATYSDGKSKDNFLVYSYVHSEPFLNPGDYEIVEQEEVANYVADYNALVTQNQQLAFDLQQAFGSNGDWLGCHTIFTALTEDSKKTLWAQAMQKNGYYDNEWNPNEEKINDLIAYINRQTKDFVFDMEDQIGTLTDSTMIKLISLRAIIAFTQRVSEFGNWLYPFSINYAEFTLKDVIASVLTSNYQLYVACKMDIASYVATQYGWVHLIVFDGLILLMYLFISIIKFVIPLLYISLCALLVVKIVMQGDLKATLRGYVKSSLLIFLLFTVYDTILVMVKHISGYTISIYILLFATLAMLAILLTLLSAIASNIMDLGDKTFGEKFTALANMLHLDNIFNNINMQAQTLMPAYRRRGSISPDFSFDQDRLDIYSLDRDIEDVYSNNVTPINTSAITYMDDLIDYNVQDVEYVDDLSSYGELDTTNYQDNLNDIG